MSIDGINASVYVIPVIAFIFITIAVIIGIMYIRGREILERNINTTFCEIFITNFQHFVNKK